MMRKTFACVAAFGGVMSLVAMPSVTLESVMQTDGRTITITYTADAEPGIVTLDILTNGAPISAQALSTAMGDVNAVIAPGTRTITWCPDGDDSVATVNAAACAVRLTAWPTNNPPDVMVVELGAGASPRVKYYTSVEALPGGLFANPRYRESALVLKRVHASGLPWVMGALAETGDAKPHTVTLDHDYYLGVFELTQAQHALTIDATPVLYYGIEGARRPSDRLTYNLLRGTTGNSSSAPETNTPEPTATSVLGKLRTLTGVAFEMPTEAEWEYAARAGVTVVKAIGTAVEGRYSGNGGMVNKTTIYAPSTTGPTNATAIVGTYAPNAWGFYDMQGNVQEWCRDWYKVDITRDNGACVADKQSTGTSANYYRVLRGGSIRTDAPTCQSANRVGLPPHGCIDNWGNFVGYRPYVSL